MGKTKLKENEGQFEIEIENQDPQEIATIIYTSGTTGEPKGAVITNHAFASMLLNTKVSLGSNFVEDDRTLTWLPLSHVFGRCDSMLAINFGWEMVFAQSQDTLINDIGAAKPTIMLSVPRIFEKIFGYGYILTYLY